MVLTCEMLGISNSSCFEYGKRKAAMQPSSAQTKQRINDEALLVRGPAPRQEIGIVDGLWGPENRGNFTD